MIRRPRSPSLFVTFASAFLGVLLLGTFLQGIVVVDLVRRLAVHSSGIESVVREVAREITGELARSPDADIRSILAARSAQPDSFVIGFRDSTGRIVLGSNVPPMLGRHLERVLRERPEGWDRRGLGPPPPGERPFPEGPPEGRRWGPPFVLAARQDVTVHGRVVGEVIGWQRPPEGFFRRMSPTTRFFLSLPMALLLASVAALIVFRSILGRLRSLERLAGRVAEGDLDVRVPDPGADEIGRLGAALNRMTERLATAKRQVEQSDRQRRRLFADISHELATPLTTIRGYAETMLDASIPTSGEERTKYLQHVLSASERMDMLILDLLELTRLEAGATALHRERIEWGALCKNTLQRFEPRFREAGLTLRWEESSGEAWIRADGRRMEQVADNLLMNALRYVPRGGTVAVSIRPVGGDSGAGYRLAVDDDGPGFPPADLPHVFDRFYRGDRAGDTAGSGLGLAIVQEIVRRHGGRARAENRSPGGASIQVELPAAGAPDPV